MLELGWIISQREWASFGENRLRQGSSPSTLDTDLNPCRHSYSLLSTGGLVTTGVEEAGEGSAPPPPSWHTIINNWGGHGREVASKH